MAALTHGHGAWCSSWQSLSWSPLHLTCTRPRLELIWTQPPVQPSPAGRGEPIRLALAAAGVDFEFEVVDKAAMKADAEHYPFGQAPRCAWSEPAAVQHTTRAVPYRACQEALRRRPPTTWQCLHSLTRHARFIWNCHLVPRTDIDPLPPAAVLEAQWWHSWNAVSTISAPSTPAGTSTMRWTWCRAWVCGVGGGGGG